MATTRLHLTGSTSGRPIPIAATATPGTLIHTAVGGGAAFDEIYLMVTNRSGAIAKLTIEFGGTAAGDHLTEDYALPPNSAPIPICPGLVLNGALVVRAFSDVASALNVSGFCNRMSV